MRVFLFILAMLFWVAPTFGAIDSGRIFGVWLTEGANSKLEIFPCGDKACAKVVWLKYPTYLNSKEDPVGMVLVDVHNPDPTMQSHPILGLQVMEGLPWKGSGGSTVRATIRRPASTTSVGCIWNHPRN